MQKVFAYAENCDILKVDVVFLEKKMNKIAKVLGNAAVAVVVTMNTDAIQMNKL